MKEQQEPIQYLLFIFDDFTKNEKIVELIALQLSAFTDKDSFVKYNHGKYGIVINLQSHFTFYEFRDYVHRILENAVSQYFLIEKPKNMYAFMPPELKLNLFDLYDENNLVEDENNVKFGKPLNMIDNFLHYFTSSISEEAFLSDEYMESMFDKVMSELNKTENTKPTVDDILDKIKDKGITSLTENEKQILDEYSKK
jgi:hypothetical protein